MTYDIPWLRSRFAGARAQAADTVYCDPDEALPGPARQQIGRAHV